MFDLSLEVSGLEIQYLPIVGLVFCAASYVTLLHLLAKAYAQIYLFRDSGYLKYLNPFNFFRKFSDRTYVLHMQERKGFTFPPLKLTNKDVETIRDGYSILLTGPRYIEDKMKANMIESIAQALDDGETVDYVCTDQHPFRIRAMLTDSLKKLGKELTDYYGTDIVIIDAFTPVFGFREDILDEERKTTRQEIPIIEASSLAGVHRAAMKAWYLHKESLKQSRGRTYRRPHRMIYDNLSTFLRFEGLEQLTTFYLHMLSAERAYKMVTYVIEYEDANVELMRTLYGTVDCILRFSAETGVSVNTKIEKMRGVDFLGQDPI
jgi:hypothetical protein